MITPSDVQVIETIVRNILFDVQTSMPVKVESVDWAAKTVTCIPQIKRLVEDKEGNITTEDPITKLTNIPIGIQRTASQFISLPISAGCFGRVVFNADDTGQWRALGKVCSASNATRHSFNGGLFIPDYYPDASVLQDTLSGELTLGTSMGVQLRAKSSTIDITTSGSTSSTGGYVALANPVESFISNFISMMSGWTPQLQDGGTALKAQFTAIFTTFVNNMKSTNLRAD